MKKKIFSIVAMAITLFLAFSLTNIVKAATNVTVENITNSDTIHDSSSINPQKYEDGNYTSLIYSNIALHTLDRGGYKGYAWLGIRVTSSNETVTKGRYTVNGGTPTTFDAKTFDEYFGVSKENLEKATRSDESLYYDIEVEWLGSDDKVVEKSYINLIINPDTVTLYNDANTEEIWNEEIFVKVMEDENAKRAEEAAKEEAKKAQETKKDEKDSTYKTGSNVAIIALIAAISSIAGIAIIKK